MISSLRRDLQREHLERLVDLTLPAGGGTGAAQKPISTLAQRELRQIRDRIAEVTAANPEALDPTPRPTWPTPVT